jgi:hypothetical protein
MLASPQSIPALQNPTPLGAWLQVDEDPLGRKRALALLQGVLPPVAAAHPPWSHWLVVYHGLEDFAAHLVTATWNHVRRPALTTCPFLAAAILRRCCTAVRGCSHVQQRACGIPSAACGS